MAENVKHEGRLGTSLVGFLSEQKIMTLGRFVCVEDDCA